MNQSELLERIEALAQKISESWAFLDLDAKTNKIHDYQALMQQPDFWSRPDEARRIAQQAKQLEEEVRTWTAIRKDTQDVLEIARMDSADQDVSLREETELSLAGLEERFAKLEFTILFSGPHDRANAILAVHAGAGGTDAMDWTQILLRMYMRFCESKGFAVRLIDESRGAEAGIKSAVIEVEGPYAFGWLKSEHGVHRLVRMSPFNADQLRQTSFALVEVLPELEDTTAIEIKSEDLRIDTFRAGGHGGQSVNKTESAVRITHIPTNIVATCQSERSQLQNKERAMNHLRAKLLALSETKAEEERKKLRGEYSEAAWGNQIRSYVLHPYQLVNDHRTEHKESDTEAVLNGRLDGFVEAFLKMKK